MKQKPTSNYHQPSFTTQYLEDLLNPRVPLYQLANRIPWELFEEDFIKLYSDKGRTAKPIRLMVGLLILKQVEDLSDEVVVERWVQNPYYQYFCGEKEFQWNFPCDPSDLVYFRKRIGAKGCEKILKISIQLHGRKALEKEILVDTTVQEKNITFPTDSKLHRKVAEQCVKIAETEGIKLRRSYKRTLPELTKAQHNRTHPKRRKKARKAAKKLKTIAGALIRELERKLTEEALQKYSAKLELFDKVVQQKRNDKNKIYSLHEVEVSCIGKGKENKKYEFGQKASIAVTRNSGIVVSALSFKNAPYDGHTLPAVLEQVEKLTGKRPSDCTTDRGYRGNKTIGETNINIPGPPKAKASPYEKSKQRKRFRKRAGIEPIIGHLKSDFRMKRNYLKGLIGDEINVLLAGAAFNFKKWLNEAVLALISLWSYIYKFHNRKTLIKSLH